MPVTNMLKILFAMAISMLLSSSIGIASELSSLSILNDKYPKAIYFRNAENSAANPNISYQKWAKRWSKLDGMVVKALDEEIPGRSIEAQGKFIQYKKDNPSKLMLLHFNGNARDPNFDFDAFKAEDWTYFVGTHSTSPITASDTRFSVVDSNVFRGADDLALVPLKDSGDLDWQNAEQVKIISVGKGNTIHVKRGLFGSKPISHKKGKAYLAPHVSQPPLAPESQQALWRYNFTNIDNDGGMPIRLTKNLLQYLGKGQPLSVFDGVEFDVLADIRGLKHHSRKTPIDYNFDGKASDEDRVFQQQYSVGVMRFLTSLRQELGDNKLILADGNELNQQRAFGILNGIESETWPSHWDPEIDTWSSGMNRHLYWNEHSHLPSFSYIKIGLTPQNKKLKNKPQDNHRRLRVAASLMMDAVAAPAYAPVGLKIDNWPELSLKKRQLGWLGKPIGPYSYMDDQSKKITQHDVSGLLTAATGTQKVSIEGAVVFKGSKGKTTRFILPIELDKPSNVIVSAEIVLNRANTKHPDRANLLTVKTSSTHEQMSWVGPENFISHYGFNSVSAGKQQVIFELEDDTAIKVRSLSVFIGDYVAIRQFEHGAVIANPTNNDNVLNIEKLNKNNGKSIRSGPQKGKGMQSSIVEVPAKDAVFYRHD
ncbi:hypothetical protein GCM10009410_32000 [Shewanella ulleungensis]|uniref:Uncharacterized protein n=1 Tax=Shewanella ulleungensis TaxID=2282699 RepID=A0ABQ2QVN5_9GAMM|nr:hypothetical protein GCM10009410_32000 [Shewanella ulleungensis]